MRRIAILFAFIGTFAIGGQRATAIDFPSACLDALHAYSVGVPDSWWTHPTDAALGVGTCERFRPRPFTLAPNDDGVLVGEQISVGWVEGCVGMVAPPKSNVDLSVGGHPARRLEFVPTSGPGSPDHALTTYWIQLTDEECEGTSRYLIASTSAAAGHYGRNVGILDEMVQTLQFDVPDSAMAHIGRGETAFVGWLLVAAAMGIAGFRYSQPRLRK